MKETADVLEISEETVTRDLKFAKVWLMGELSRSRVPLDGTQLPRPARDQPL